ncbi:glycosyl transferase, family 25 [Pedobacter steynii]|uniref:Glycosyl transferase, family 25 n=1 Tax=Pedobacter steynii TaxID=430522 RepID=A0A1H0L6R8_9SPHI|nr:hypothetical protein [Pedobacter steynii]NQX43431.1 glycosyl transferase [Pedobacter steynii]SDO63918.1 glycosyl transferase, family 25 [Pedobacter steynii]
MQQKINTYIINLAKRTDRKAHILGQFKHRPEFNVQLVKAILHENGALGLWQTVVHIIRDLVPQEDDYILICEDDHQFTDAYHKEILFNEIANAQKKGADVLLGGVSWFADALQIKDNLFWVDKFNATQFLIVFQGFYTKLLEAESIPGYTADQIIYERSENKFLIYPFISTQKEFGYSDATIKNNKEGYVTEIFETSDIVLSHIVKVAEYYR